MMMMMMMMMKNKNKKTARLAALWPNRHTKPSDVKIPTPESQLAPAPNSNAPLYDLLPRRRRKLGAGTRSDARSVLLHQTSLSQPGSSAPY